MQALLISGLCTIAFLAVLTVALLASRGLRQLATAGYGLDLLVTLMTGLPSVVGAVYGGWWGLAGAILGSLGALYAFCLIHPLIKRQQRQTIIGLLNRRVGFFRNQIALLATLPAVPLFLYLRYAEIFLYPFFIVLVRFPRYDQKAWVNVSRHKYEGLAGADLIWCLYCDWMTGVVSLAAEMLRNVESFWCPVRFDSTKKCANCRTDFPDIDTWATPKDGSVKPVVKLLEEKYFSGTNRTNSWFGHPDRKKK
ncbi:hypothetical protein GC173_15740 [bacterium]|nr:hypothetical protein [bacterium]